MSWWDKSQVVEMSVVEMSVALMSVGQKSRHRNLGGGRNIKNQNIEGSEHQKQN